MQPVAARGTTCAVAACKSVAAELDVAALPPYGRQSTVAWHSCYAAGVFTRVNAEVCPVSSLGVRRHQTAPSVRRPFVGGGH
jgi:hypothetical protein